jgi:hypothetical protein
VEKIKRCVTLAFIPEDNNVDVTHPIAACARRSLMDISLLSLLLAHFVNIGDGDGCSACTSELGPATSEDAVTAQVLLQNLEASCGRGISS